MSDHIQAIWEQVFVRNCRWDMRDENGSMMLDSTIAKMAQSMADAAVAVWREQTFGELPACFEAGGKCAGDGKTIVDEHEARTLANEAREAAERSLAEARKALEALQPLIVALSKIDAYGDWNTREQFEIAKAAARAALPATPAKTCGDCRLREPSCGSYARHNPLHRACSAFEPFPTQEPSEYCESRCSAPGRPTWNCDNRRGHAGRHTSGAWDWTDEQADKPALDSGRMRTVRGFLFVSPSGHVSGTWQDEQPPNDMYRAVTLTYVVPETEGKGGQPPLPEGRGLKESKANADQRDQTVD